MSEKLLLCLHLPNDDYDTNESVKIGVQESKNQSDLTAGK